jgi:23S rRNA pseudouridine2457 synthase
MQAFSYFVIYKPFGILSQFSSEGNKAGLGELFPFPKDVYPVGRLDADSEGLLLLTNDKKLNHRLLNPDFRHWRTYWVQVDGSIDETGRKKLATGVPIKVNKKVYQTMPAKATILEEPSHLPERIPPIRYRKDIPTSWLALSLQEGKNRQVRRMTAAVGFPTLRLVRVGIENLSLHDMGMQPGEVRELKEEVIYDLLKLKKSGVRTPDRKIRGGK